MYSLTLMHNIPSHTLRTMWHLLATANVQCVDATWANSDNHNLEYSDPADQNAMTWYCIFDLTKSL